ncbi:cupin domain-containing protein [Fimbriimonas ginsengisoli]|uniref:Cupin 2 barrel domain-containing protein n=1 Tax=Fimbriimonas ginsengisoli Gsoil 348 TaxID=661478 RepID=A0A068NYS0_FIMGI|nr:cupin domain-containing protein [Fimbriimonas ginsengisoli]AIE87309.1 cupin 2 barrel domain-containing protein [Fimbriimonas ginsengisoli Gsoil 348]
MATVGTDRVHVVRNSDTYEGKQGLTYFTGISKESTGSKGVCLHALNIPPSGRANAHYHDGHESAIYMLSGHAEQLWGDQLENHDEIFPGDYVYIPSGVPHVVMNASSTEPIMAVIARTDPNEQESVVLTPELEARVDEFLKNRK